MFVPTIFIKSKNPRNLPNYKISLIQEFSVVFFVMDKKEVIDVSDFNKRLKYLDWNVEKLNTKIREKTAKVTTHKFQGNDIIEFYDLGENRIASFELPKQSVLVKNNKTAQKNELPSSSYSLSDERTKYKPQTYITDQFCSQPKNTNPPDYSKFIDYLQKNHSPCPNQTRGSWAKAQFYRLGMRIEELQKEKPKEAANLMRDYNKMLSNYIITEAQTGFEDDKSFDKCINFMYDVDTAIDDIRSGN